MSNVFLLLIGKMGNESTMYLCTTTFHVKSSWHSYETKIIITRVNHTHRVLSFHSYMSCTCNVCCWVSTGAPDQSSMILGVLHSLFSMHKASNKYERCLCMNYTDLNPWHSLEHENDHVWSTASKGRMAFFMKTITAATLQEWSVCHK